MATLALAAAGAAVGSALLPAGVSALGLTLSGAAIGSEVGAIGGSFVDQALFGASGQSRLLQGPRLSDLHVTASTEGAPIPRIYGSVRLGAQVIWATAFDEEVVTTSSSSGGGGKGGSGGAASSGGTTVVKYTYYANFAVALCEGPINGIGRVWADSQELDLTTITYRLYLGDENQQPDSLITANEGAELAPAYRGIAYIVFEHLPLAAFGNRIPQLSFETYRAVDDVHAQIRGVVLIPGSGEFVYATQPVTELGASGARGYENVHTLQGVTDWQVSLDELQAALPNARSVSLVVSWFGTDLRADQCKIRPAVEISVKEDTPFDWSVAGLGRADAYVVSQVEGRPAYGGTPSDQSVIEAIADLKSRGLSVTLTPFVLMDIPAGNALADPYEGTASQPAYPWRGRVTLDPAPGRPGSPDKTAAATTQIAHIVGRAAPGDFTVSGNGVVYSGPDEWSLRRQILHYASLAQAAGGVDAFVIGTEMRGLEQARSGPGTYPFVDALVALAADVRSIVGSQTRITYAADWSDYFGHQPQDGSGDVYFHLDPLWSSPNIDAIGIDLYWPLADWRNGDTHADALAGARSIFDLGYLKGNIVGGEGYTWYYADPADRTSQTRTPITDGAAGKPWVFRPKDLRSWWSNQHFNRPGGVEVTTPTAWIPQAKPFWFMEIGCPAVDLGANEPNVFVDPKSSESSLPYFSRGQRDDLMQRRYLQGLLEAFDPASPACIPGLNPPSAVYSGSMVDVSRIHVYAWDARPFPAFPNDTASWGDGDNWQLGHWLNGRIASAPLSDVVATMLDEFGFGQFDASTLEGVVAGYAIDRLMSAREALQPLELAYFFDALESGGRILFRHRGAAAPVASLTTDDMVDSGNARAPLALTRGQETELPLRVKVAYVSAALDYRQAIAEARKSTVVGGAAATRTGASGRVAQASLAIVLDTEVANATAESWLYETWAAREQAAFSLPPSQLAIEPGDILDITVGSRQRLYRVTEITERGERQIVALSIDPSVYAASTGAGRIAPLPASPTAGQAVLEFVDLPLLRGDEPAQAGYVAANQSPWPGSLALFSSPEVTGFSLRMFIGAPSTMGTTLSALAAGPVSRIDHFATLTVRLDGGQLSSTTLLQMLAGANIAAVRQAAGTWEILQFQTATLVAPSTYQLSGLLRGQAGTEAQMQPRLAAGARFILIDAAVTQVDLAAAEVGLPLNWRYGPASRDLGDQTYVQSQFAFAGVGQRPLSPVALTGTRDSAGNLLIKWIRRTRIGGDPWEVVEVPLGEETESYEVDIHGPGGVVRTISATSSSVTYTAAQQIADLGAIAPSVTADVYQLGAVWGRGVAAAVVI